MSLTVKEEQRCVVHYYFLRCKTASQCLVKLQKVYGPRTLSCTQVFETWQAAIIRERQGGGPGLYECVSQSPKGRPWWPLSGSPDGWDVWNTTATTSRKRTSTFDTRSRVGMSKDNRKSWIGIRNNKLMFDTISASDVMIDELIIYLFTKAYHK